jgi:DNA-binding IclR family transcriptional regulator
MTQVTFYHQQQAVLAAHRETLPWRECPNMETTMTATADVSMPTPSMVTRITAILDTFDTSRSCRSLQDIASLTGLPRSTAYRILEQLVQLGWVQHNLSGYRLGWRANRLPSRANEESRLREVAAPHLYELAVHTQLTVHLAVLDGPFARYLDKIGGGAARIPSRVGGTLPAHLTAIGQAMLAYVDPESLDAVLGRLRMRVDVTGVHRDLAAVRMRGGLAATRNGPLAAVACIGAPIFDSEHSVTGGLSLCDGGSGAPLDRYVPILLERAKRISAQLGQLQQTGIEAPPTATGGLDRRSGDDDCWEGMPCIPYVAARRRAANGASAPVTRRRDTVDSATAVPDARDPAPIRSPRA